MVEDLPHRLQANHSDSDLILLIGDQGRAVFRGFADLEPAKRDVAQDLILKKAELAWIKLKYKEEMVRRGEALESHSLDEARELSVELDKTEWEMTHAADGTFYFVPIAALYESAEYVFADLEIDDSLNRLESVSMGVFLTPQFKK